MSITYYNEQRYIVSNLIDIVSSLAMNGVSNWWLYQIVMTLYVISMPMLAAVWTSYAIVYIWCDITVEDQQKKTIEAGMTYHLSKPIDPSLLYHVLSTYLVQNS